MKAAGDSADQDNLRGVKATCGRCNAVTEKGNKKMTKDSGSAVETAFEDSQRELYKHPGYLIRRLHQISVSIFLTQAQEYDLTQVQWGALTMIDANPGIDQTALGRLIAIDRQTVSTVVQRLCEKGLLRREQKDRRSSALFVTGAAKALIKIMREQLPAVDQILLEPLTATERRVFMELLTKLVNVNNSLSRAPLGPGESPKRSRKVSTDASVI